MRIRTYGLRCGARDQEGQPLGYSLIVPVWVGNAENLASHSVLGPLLQAHFEKLGWDTLPSTLESSRVFYFLRSAHKGIQAQAVTAALCRDAFGVFASEGGILIVCAPNVHKDLFGALGFEHVPINDVT